MSSKVNNIYIWDYKDNVIEVIQNVPLNNIHIQVDKGITIRDIKRIDGGGLFISLRNKPNNIRTTIDYGQNNYITININKG